MHSISKLLAGSIVAFGAARSVVTAGGVKFAGVNIAGFDFGCGTDVYPSLFSSLYKPMTFFNIDRFPTGHLHPLLRRPAPRPVQRQ